MVFFALRVNEMKNPDSILEEKKMSNKELSSREKMIKKLSDKSAVKPSRKKQKVFILSLFFRNPLLDDSEDRVNCMIKPWSTSIECNASHTNQAHH